MIALEVLGRISHSAMIPDTTAAVNQLRKLSQIDPRYANYPTVHWHVFRNGIAHLFLPKRLANQKVRGSVFWSETQDPKGGLCVDDSSIASPLPGLRRSHHLVDRREPDGTITLRLAPQVLYFDVLHALDEFAASLAAPTPQVQADFESGFDAWWDGVETLRVKPDPTELAQLQAIT